MLEVPERGYFAWRRRPGSRRTEEDDRLQIAIRAIFTAHRGAYGVPRITEELRFMGHRVNRKRVVRLMKEMALQGKQKRKFKPQTTTVDPEGPVFPDLLRQDFTADMPNKRWVGDITYLETNDGFEYLATVIDLYSRRVVGWALATSLETNIIVRALQMALTQRQPEPGVIFHSDRGCQYTSQEFRNFCIHKNVQQSMGRTGCCYDNAAAESFFHSLKVEWLSDLDLTDRQTMRTEVFHYIEGYYNCSRRHSTIGYLCPIDFENTSSNNSVNAASRHHAPPRSTAKRASDKTSRPTAQAADRDGPQCGNQATSKALGPSTTRVPPSHWHEPIIAP